MLLYNMNRNKNITYLWKWGFIERDLFLTAAKAV